MRTVKPILFVLLVILLASCDSVGLYGFRVDDSRVKPLESGTCDSSGIIELNPFAEDGTDAVVRVEINGQVRLLGTKIYIDAQKIAHRIIPVAFKSETVYVSARGAENQPIWPTLKIVCQ